MGDPTLRMHVVAPPTNLLGATNGGGLTLSWNASSDSVAGYHVYGSSSPNGPFTRLTSSLVSGTTYTVNNPSNTTYMVRAVKLETTPSGSYFNPSQGAFLLGSGAVIVAGGGGGGGGGTNTPAPAPTNIVTWVDDALPAGAVGGADGGDSWNWVSSNPTRISGSVASQSSIGPGLHEHYFAWASQTLTVNTGEVLIAYVYLDPANLPTEIMLQWHNGTWEHRAYWGANNITYGTDGTSSRKYMGALPPAGQWVRLQVPASQVGLEGSTLGGMA